MHFRGVNMSKMCASADWRLWFGPGVRFPAEALHPCGGDPVVPITRAAAWSQGEKNLSSHTCTWQTYHDFVTTQVILIKLIYVFGGLLVWLICIRKRKYPWSISYSETKNHWELFELKVYLHRQRAKVQLLISTHPLSQKRRPKLKRV